MSAKPYWVLVFSLLGVSFAGPLVRLSTADPVAVAVWRLGFSLLIVGGFLVVTGEWRDWIRITSRELALAALGGVSLALHFWAWNASIHLTTIAASVTLVSLQPAVVATISAVALKEAPTTRQVIGIAIAILGALIIAAPDLEGGIAPGGNAPLLGNLLAASAAVTAAIYYTIGRRLRKSLGIWSYVGIVYSTALLTLAVIAIARGVTLAPQPPREIAIFAGLALGPMLLGHTGMNWALKFLPAYVVNLTVLGEPVGATLLGALIPSIRQIPTTSTLIGGAVVLGGVIIAAERAPRRSTVNV
ncbi:MAG TPA: DMT family transporter [Gemmatimonadaceae bacterium]|jgi:drug/metabolite transporter (DMT)-like permease|nr:DMT family transporter [Gemmatimonadaceae bacterium]